MHVESSCPLRARGGRSPTAWQQARLDRKPPFDLALACFLPPIRLPQLGGQLLSEFVLFCVVPEGAPWRKRESWRLFWLRTSSATVGSPAPTRIERLCVCAACAAI